MKRVYPEYTISFNVKPDGNNTYRHTTYIIYSGIFRVYWQQKSTQLNICYYYGYRYSCIRTDDELPLDKYTNVQLTQKCINDTDNGVCERYKYELTIDGVALRRGTTTVARVYGRQYMYFGRAKVFVKDMIAETSLGGGIRTVTNLEFLEIPILKRQWFLSVDIMPMGTISKTTNILHATLGGNVGRVGDRIPAIWFLPSSTRLLICSAVNGNKNYCFNTNSLQIGSFTNVQIRQAFDVSVNKYRYIITVNGTVVHSVINGQPREFDDVFLYASDPWYHTANAYVKNIVFKNIPHGYTYAGCRTERDEMNFTCSNNETSSFRSIDGTCNNLDNPTWGASETSFRRLIKPAYSKDGLLDTPRGFPGKNPILPPANAVSQELFGVDRMNTGNENSISTLFMTFGQFLDHDLVMTPHSACHQPCDSYNAWQYPCFPLLFNDSNSCSPNGRSDAVCNTKAYLEPREQMNLLPAYVDGSQIYGSNLRLFQDLRQHRNGLMSVSSGNLLPFSSFQGYIQRSGGCHTIGGCSLVGDERGDENIALHSMHTLWVREHNRIARELSRINPNWNDEKLYQTTRKIIVALWQRITFNEYVPILTDIQAYTGYKPNTDPSIINAFATAAFRYGHALIPDEFAQLDKNFDQQYNPVPLQAAFFNRQFINSRGIEPTMFGLIGNMSNDVGPSFSFAVARKLFIGVGRSGYLDLAALNIQRGRDHGLPGYNEYRKHCGLKSIRSWSDLEAVMLPNVTSKFREIYSSPGDIDLYAGGISEKHVHNREIGPTFICIMKQQFTALRDGDRFYYENPSVFTDPQINAIKKVTMASVLCNNLNGIVSIQRDVFRVPDCRNKRTVCSSIDQLDLSLWRDADSNDEPGEMNDSYLSEQDDEVKIPIETIGSQYEVDVKLLPKFLRQRTPSLSKLSKQELLHKLEKIIFNKETPGQSGAATTSTTSTTTTATTTSTTTTTGKPSTLKPTNAASDNIFNEEDGIERLRATNDIDKALKKEMEQPRLPEFLRPHKNLSSLTKSQLIRSLEQIMFNQGEPDLEFAGPEEENGEKTLRDNKIIDGLDAANDADILPADNDVNDHTKADKSDEYYFKHAEDNYLKEQFRHDVSK